VTFVCPLCGRRFRRWMALKIHFAKVHGLGNRCPVCGQHFNKHMSLMKHLCMVNDGLHVILRCLLCRPKGTLTKYAMAALRLREEDRA